MILFGKKHSKNIDMLNGSMWDKILLFALPVAASGILQQLFNAADIAVVGRYAGSIALAAVGSNGAVINMIVNTFLGMSVGANVVIAAAIGRGDGKRVSAAVHTAIALAVICGFILAVLGFFFAPKILELISTPAEILTLASLYLRIYFMGMPFIMLFNFEAAVLRSNGETQKPLNVLIVSGIINVVLNLFFVIICKMTVEGVAIATVIANVVSSIWLFRFLVKYDGQIRLNPKGIKLDIKSFISIIKIGVPSGLQGTFFSISNVCIQSAINTLGSTIVAASAVALNYEYIAYFLLNSFDQACVTFGSQNLGAGKIRRAKKATVISYIWACAITMTVCVIFLFFNRFFNSFFTTDSDVIKFAFVRMKYILWPEPLNVGIAILSGALRALRHPVLPAVACVVGICGLRVVWVNTIFAWAPSFEHILLCYAVSWVVTITPIFIAYILIMRKMERKGKL